MPYLLIVSFIWAFSFGLIKGRLAGLDSGFISAARLGLALLVFLPFFRLRGLNARLIASLAAIGAVQFGVMYLAYNASFRYLKAHEIALFTLTTPIFVTLLADALDRNFRLRCLLAALLAVLGALAVTLTKNPVAGIATGIVLVQISNAAFAIGQVAYQRLRRNQPALRDRDVFALLYAGALVLTLPIAAARADFAWPALTATHVSTLIYLGVIASGLGFFLWNFGATKVRAGTLAVMNNLKIPLAVACSLVFFGEKADLTRLLVAGALMALAVWLAESGRRNGIQAES